MISIDKDFVPKPAGCSRFVRVVLMLAVLYSLSLVNHLGYLQTKGAGDLAFMRYLFMGFAKPLFLSLLLFIFWAINPALLRQLRWTWWFSLIPLCLVIVEFTHVLNIPDSWQVGWQTFKQVMYAKYINSAISLALMFALLESALIAGLLDPWLGSMGGESSLSIHDVRSAPQNLRVGGVGGGEHSPTVSGSDEVTGVIGRLAGILIALDVFKEHILWGAGASHVYAISFHGTGLHSLWPMVFAAAGLLGALPATALLGIYLFSAFWKGARSAVIVAMIFLFFGLTMINLFQWWYALILILCLHPLANALVRTNLKSVLKTLGKLYGSSRF